MLIEAVRSVGLILEGRQVAVSIATDTCTSFEWGRPEDYSGTENAPDPVIFAQGTVIR